MKSPQSHLIDLSLTQAIEGYRTMDPAGACAAIASEWPSQTAILLAVFLFNSTCKNCGDQVDLMRFKRRDGLSHFVALVCKCRQEI